MDKPFTITTKIENPSQEVKDWLSEVEDILAEKMKTARMKITITHPFEEEIVGLVHEVVSELSMHQLIYGFDNVKYTVEALHDKA